jgi:hypothetical protein
MVRKKYVVVRAALAGGEDRLIDTLLKIFRGLYVFPEEDKPSSRTTESFVTEGPNQS